MNLSKFLYWDVDESKIDFDLNFHWVITRVFDRGDVEDIRQVRRYYGDEKIREVLLNTKYLSRRRIWLASAVINEPVENFRAYKLQELNPTLYPY